MPDCNDCALYLIRHCAAQGQAPGAALTDSGHRQAEELADALAEAGIDRIIASPYRRAVDSITPLALRLGLTVETDVRLVERVLSAEPLTDWRARLRASFDDPELRFPGGESSVEAMARGADALQAIVRGETRRPAIVTHGNLLTLILRGFDPRYGFDQWEAMTNPDIYRVTPARRDGMVERLRTA